MTSLNSLATDTLLLIPSLPMHLYRSINTRSSLLLHKPSLQIGRNTSSYYSCIYCPKTFVYKRQLLTHHDRAHLRELPFACTKCRRKFADVSYLSDHVLTHVIQSVLICTACSMSFTSKYLHSKHKCSGSLSFTPSTTSIPRLNTCSVVLRKLEDNSRLGPVLADEISRYIVKRSIRRGRGVEQTQTLIRSSNGLERHSELFPEVNSYCTRVSHEINVSNRNIFLEVNVDILKCSVVNTDNSVRSKEVSDFIPKLGAASNEEDTESDNSFKGSSPRCQDDLITDDHIILPPSLLSIDDSLEMKADNSGEQGVYTYKQCSKKFSTDVSLTRHLKHKHKCAGSDEAEYCCKVCDKKLSSLYGLKRHELTHTSGEQEYACAQCDKKFKLADRLSVHVKRVHVKEHRYKCKECNKTFFNSTELNLHASRMHIVEQPFLCGECGKIFVNARDFKVHTAVHSGGDDEHRYVCMQCDKKFTAAMTLKIHMRTHTGEHTHVCAQCDAKFISSSHLNRHRRRVHDEQQYACTQCDKKFSYVGDYTLHKLLHDGERMFECTQCDKRFNLLSYLQNHIRRVHSGERVFYLCTQCGKRFSEKSTLNAHRLNHTGERPHACSQCHKTFTRSSSLKVHVRQVHSSERLFLCALCEKRFATSGNLKVHEQIHSGERRHVCEKCNELLLSRVALLRHYELFHGGCECTVCHKRFTQTDQLQCRLRSHCEASVPKLHALQCGVTVT